MPKKETRQYALSDGRMLESADTMLMLYCEDAPLFQQFDGQIFHTEYAAGFLAEINYVRSLNLDRLVVREQSKVTRDVSVKMEACKSCFRDLKYWVKKAFPENKAIWNQFGFNDYSKVRHFYLKILQFMETVAATVEQYRMQLIAVGYTSEKIRHLRELTHGLRAERIDREMTKKTVP